MSVPAVSLLLPSYNQAEFLPEALESALAQQFRDFELIVADGGSRDDSREVIARYAARDARIRVCHPPEDPGVAGNWNHCLDAARGGLVKFLFGDDFFVSSHTLGRLRDALAAHPSAVLATSATRVVDARSQPLRVRQGLRRAGLHPGRRVAVDCLRRLSNFVGEPSLVMFRRPADGARFDARYRHFVDLEFWLRLLAQGDAVQLAEPLTAFREHTGQLTARNVAAGADAIEARWLVSDALRHPVLGPALTRADLFLMRYSLGKRSAPAGPAAEVDADLLKRIGRTRYAALWLAHKLRRPFSNLARALRRDES